MMNLIANIKNLDSDPKIVVSVYADESVEGDSKPAIVYLNASVQDLVLADQTAQKFLEYIPETLTGFNGHENIQKAKLAMDKVKYIRIKTFKSGDNYISKAIVRYTGTLDTSK